MKSIKTPPDQLRTEIMKTPQNKKEDDRFRNVCAATGKQRAPVVRGLINAYCDAFDAAVEAAKKPACNKTHVSASRTNSEWPWHGHIASAFHFPRSKPVHTPGRSSCGGAPVPMRV